VINDRSNCSLLVSCNLAELLGDPLEQLVVDVSSTAGLTGSAPSTVMTAYIQA
jgi:hypothetical protein